MDEKIAYVRTGEQNWHKRDWQELRAGDVFMLLDRDGEFIEYAGSRGFFAVNDASLADNGECWIDAVPYDLGE